MSAMPQVAAPVHRFRVALHDVDAAGILFFAHLFRHAHDAYELAMAELGSPLDGLIREGALGLPLVHAEADFRRPLRHGALVEVRTSLGELSERRFVVHYRFESDAALAATATSVHVAIDPATGRSIPLPRTLIDLLNRFPPLVPV